VNGGGHVFRMNIRLHFASYSCCEFFYLSNMRSYPIGQTNVKVCLVRIALSPERLLHRSSFPSTLGPYASPEFALTLTPC
jgi:hypothetical protein